MKGAQIGCRRLRGNHCEVHMIMIYNNSEIWDGLTVAEHEAVWSEGGRNSSPPVKAFSVSHLPHRQIRALFEFEMVLPVSPMVHSPKRRNSLSDSCWLKSPARQVRWKLLRAGQTRSTLLSKFASSMCRTTSDPTRHPARLARDSFRANLASSFRCSGQSEHSLLTHRNLQACVFMMLELTRLCHQRFALGRLKSEQGNVHIRIRTGAQQRPPLL